MLKRHASDERGAVMVFVTLVLVMMLGVAAMVVDLGYAREKKRQQQNSADAAALGAAQDLPNIVAAADRAQSLALSNLPNGAFPWSTCTDSGKFAIASTASQCISFDSSFTQIRVKIPTQSHNTLFAKVLGTDTLSTNATAAARIVAAGFASIQPFGLYAGFDTGVACLKTGAGGHSNVVCNGPVDGNFNMLDIRMYGNTTLKTTQRCGNSNQSTRLTNNIALGADHLFSIWTAAPDKVDECGTPGPNTIETRTGNFLSAFDAGILHATAGGTVDDGGPARLLRGSYPKTTGTIAGVRPDNKPLWEFIGAGNNPDAIIADIPSSCQRSAFNTALAANVGPGQKDAMYAALQLCFDDYETGGSAVGCTGPCEGVVFGLDTTAETPINLYDIQMSPRYAYVPVFVEGNPPSGSSANVHIAGFQAVFMQGIFGGCSSNSCSVEFEPGPWNTASQGAANTSIESLVAFVFADTMLPGGLASTPNAIGANYYVELTQ